MKKILMLALILCTVGLSHLYADAAATQTAAATLTEIAQSRTPTPTFTSTPNAAQTLISLHQTQTAQAYYTHTYTPTFTATPTGTRTNTPVNTATATKTASPTRTRTPSATPTITLTSTVTPISYQSGKMYTYRPGASSGAEAISYQPCYLMSIDVDAAPCGNTLNFYNVASLTGLQSYNFVFPFPLQDCGYDPKHIQYGYLDANGRPVGGRYFGTGMVVSKTASTIQGTVTIYIP